jgi:hypothetical protein
MRSTSLIGAVLFVAMATGCHDKTSPGAASSPTTTNPTIARLLIDGADAVLTGSSSSYTATATLSDGTTRSLTPTWSSSNSEVAHVDNVGRLDGRAHGTTMLTATHDGMTATKSVRVVNDYRGAWIGRFVVNGCDAPPGVCLAYEVDVFDFPIQLQVVQTGNDLSEISANFLLPSFFQLRADLTGTVSSDGHLHLAGSSDVRDHRDNVWATFHVGAWDTTLNGHDGMSGRWAQRLSRMQPPSNEIMENELVTMTRTSTPSRLSRAASHRPNDRSER